MAGGIFTPYNVACGSGIVTVNLPRGSTLQCDTWHWDDMLLNSPNSNWNSNIWFRFRSHHRSRHIILHQSPKFYPNRTILGGKKMSAPCNVAFGSGIVTVNSPSGSTLQCDTWLCHRLWWHAIEFAQTSAILEFYIWFRFRPHHHSRHVILHQSPKFLPNRTTVGRKRMMSWRFSRWRISAILDFRWVQ